MSKATARLLLALSQVPVFGGFALWWQRVQERSVAAVAIALTYEALLFVFAFGKKVWAKIEDKAVERTADWLWTGIVSFAPGFRRYQL
ncbi:MAG: hypothetical protein ACJ74J_07860 [Blastocatellia bacterium]